MIWLPDGNVLIALTIRAHAEHQRALGWLNALREPFATCSVSQGTLLRMHMHLAQDHSADAAWKALAGIEAHPLHVYWDTDLPYRDVPHRLIQGHRQVTDAWLGGACPAQWRQGGDPGQGNGGHVSRRGGADLT